MTEWVAPGEGNTVMELCRIPGRPYIPKRLFERLTRRKVWDVRTNLRAGGLADRQDADRIRAALEEVLS